MRRLLLLFSAFAAATADPTCAADGLCTATTRHRVWIDTDCSAGVPGRDIDDALALLHVLRQPHFELVGVSVVFGNAELAEEAVIVKDIIARFGGERYASLPVYEGAIGPHDIDNATPAVRGMLEALKGGPISILAIGPVTNVAALLRQHPQEAARGITEIIAVAGRRPGHRFTTGTKNPAGHPDLNFEKDPEAFREIVSFNSKLPDLPVVPVTLCPFELSSQVWLTAEDLRYLRDGGGAVGAWVHDVGLPWLALWDEVFGVDGFNPFDSLAAFYLDGAVAAAAATAAKSSADNAAASRGATSAAGNDMTESTSAGNAAASGAVAVEPLLLCEELPAWIEEGPSDGADPRMQGEGTSVPLKPYLHVAAAGPPSRLSLVSRRVNFCHSPLLGAKEALLSGLMDPAAEAAAS